MLEPLEDLVRKNPRRVRKAMRLLPSREEEFVDLYFFRRVTQVKIAEKHDVGLPVVGYRLLRAQERLLFETSRASARSRRRLVLWSVLVLLFGTLLWLLAG